MKILMKAGGSFMSEINPLNRLEPDFTATDPYAILGLSRTVTQVEIKRTYFSLIRQYPPETEGDTFKIIRGAYEKIKNAQRRQETDMFLPQKPTESWIPPNEATLLNFETNFHPSDALTVLRYWGELGRTDFQADFREIKL